MAVFIRPASFCPSLLPIVAIHEPGRLRAIIHMPSIDAGTPGKYRSWICDSGRSQLLYQLIADAPRGLGMLLLIHCLGHLLLLPARIEPVQHKDANKEHDSAYRHTDLLT